MKRENTIKTKLQWCLEKQDRNLLFDALGFSLKNLYLDRFRSTSNTWTLGTLEVCKKWSLTEQKEYLNRGHKTFAVKKKWENGKIGS